MCDQVNHGRFIQVGPLLQHPRVRKVFLLREPRAAIASIVDVLGRHYGFDLDAAVERQLTRLRELRRYTEQEPLVGAPVRSDVRRACGAAPA